MIYPPKAQEEFDSLFPRETPEAFKQWLSMREQKSEAEPTVPEVKQPKPFRAALEHEELFDTWKECDKKRVELTEQCKAYGDALEGLINSIDEEYIGVARPSLQRAKETLDKYPKPCSLI